MTLHGAIVADSKAVFAVSLNLSRTGVLDNDDGVRAVLGQMVDGGASNGGISFGALAAMHASDGYSGLLLFGKFHQLRFGGVFTASNEFLSGILSLISEDHELASVHLADVVGLHVVRKEVFSGVVDVSSSYFVLRSSQAVHHHLEGVF